MPNLYSSNASEIVPTLTRNQIPSRLWSGVLSLLLLAVGAALVIVAAVMIDVIDEGLMHNLTTFESEPKEGWDYWRWKAIKEAMSSWIICGGIWLSLFGATLYFAYRSGKNARWRGRFLTPQPTTGVENVR